jgi:hypothetical protein
MSSFQTKTFEIQEVGGRKGRFPKQSASDKVEKALHTWLQHNLQRSRIYCPERWDNLNKAFGEGWEYDFSPTLRH